MAAECPAAFVDPYEYAHHTQKLSRGYDPPRPSVCVCGHPRANHADCGRGPCRTNVEIALWHDSNDRKVTGCKCRSYSEPIETVVESDHRGKEARRCANTPGHDTEGRTSMPDKRTSSAKDRFETTFTLTISILAESEEAAEQESIRAQVRLLESKALGKNARIKYLEPSDFMDHMESGVYRP